MIKVKVYFSKFHHAVKPSFIHNSVVVDTPEEADVIIFMGGTDVNPLLYGEKKHHTTNNPDVVRDAGEVGLFLQYPDKVKLGICRGSQLLTVVNGGKLVQNVNNHAIGGQHEMSYNGKTVTATSTHHQMMYPFNLPEENYEIIAHCENRSNEYSGGNGQMKVPVDPEVVLYPKTKSLACQPHPEWMAENSEFVIELNKTLNKLL